MNATPTPAYLQSLREVTRPAHHALEHFIGGEKLQRGELEPDHYRDLLRGHHWFHEEVARHLRHFADELSAPILDWPACSRLMALETDLRQLGAWPNPAPLPGLPLRSPAYAVGLAYVAEGSSLGNRQLHRGLSQQPRFQEWGVESYLLACQADLSARWKTFLQQMQPYGEQDFADLQAGALNGFDYFQQLWMAMGAPRGRRGA